MRMIVMCPDGPVTGGVEALHQLVDSARRQQIPASICYYPGGRTEVVPAYAHYDIEVSASVPDASDVLVVVPETSPYVLSVLGRARTAMWWLSVDNYFSTIGVPTPDPTAPVEDPEILRDLLRPDSRVIHVTQSDYARSFLQRRSVRSTMLTDYLSSAFVDRAQLLQKQPKKDLVLFNPRKGLAFTERLMAASAGVLEWQPIQGLSAGGVADLLGEAKLYVDFGEHPGRDRIPREAALSGCCVITGRRGAAAHPIDVPIPDRFRLDESRGDVVDTFVGLARDTIDRFDLVTEEFAPYREWIAGQQDAFAEQTRALWAAALKPVFKGAPVGRGKSSKQKARKR
ncbi:MAG: hypothetical protein JWN95_2145 [Frankiales bacterium]|nr:hypothetical protein [Frankiales bacterium]